MAYTNVGAYTIIKTAKDNIFAKGGFVGEARIKAEPDHKNNKVKFSFAGYKGRVVPNTSGDSCSWSIPIKVYIGFSKVSYDDAKSKASSFDVEDSASSLTGYYPTSWTTPISKSIEVSCNDWGTPVTTYVYFRCISSETNNWVYDKFTNKYNVLDTTNSSTTTAINALFPYLCDRVAPSITGSNGTKIARVEQDTKKNVGYAYIQCSTTSDYNDSYCYDSYKNKGWTYTNSTYSWGCNYTATLAYSNGYMRLPYRIYYNGSGTEPTGGISSALYGNKEYTDIKITCTKDKNGKKTSTTLGTLDLRVPKITLSNFTVDSNKKITFTMTPTIGSSTTCYVYGVQYRINGGSWTNLSSGVIVSTNKTKTITYDSPVNSPIKFTVQGVDGDNNIEVRAIRQSNYIRGYSAVSTVTLSTPEIIGTPTYTVTGNGKLKLKFKATEDCNYFIKSSASSSQISGSANANTEITKNVTLSTTSNTKITITLTNPNYPALSTSIDKDIYSIVPNVKKIDITNDGAKYYLEWSGADAGYAGGSISMVVTNSEGKVIGEYEANASSNGKEKLEIGGIDSSYNVEIRRTVDTLGDGVNGYLKLFTTKYLGKIDASRPKVNISNINVDYSNEHINSDGSSGGGNLTIEYSVVVDGENYGSEDMKYKVSLYDSRGEPNAIIEGSGGGNNLSSSVIIDVNKIYTGVCIEASLNGFTDSQEDLDEISYPNSCKIRLDDTYKDAIPFIYNESKGIWEFADAYVYKEAKGMWKLSTKN